MNVSNSEQLVTGDIQARLRFIVPQDTTPYFLSQALTGGETELHFDTEEHTVTVHDVRSAADGFSLDREGFQLFHHETVVADLYDDAAIDGAYRQEIGGFLKQVTGASRVVVFDHTRRSDGPVGAENPDGKRGAALLAHVDFTVSSGPERAQTFLGVDEYDRILAFGGRIAEVNVWRPIKGPVQRAPLALADAGTVKPAELIVTEQKYPDRVGEIYLVAHGADQRWCWVPGMEPDEVLLIKGWDSLEDGRARFTPHSAFPLPDQDAGAPTRESIETRTFVIFDG